MGLHRLSDELQRSCRSVLEKLQYISVCFMRFQTSFTKLRRLKVLQRLSQASQSFSSRFKSFFCFNFVSFVNLKVSGVASLVLGDYTGSLVNFRGSLRLVSVGFHGISGYFFYMDSSGLQED